MMLYPAINELNELTDSRYTLVVLAAKRARDIIDGKPVLTEVDVERPVSLATNEIAEGKIKYKRVDAPVEKAETASFDNFELALDGDDVEPSAAFESEAAVDGEIEAAVSDSDTVEQDA